MTSRPPDVPTAPPPYRWALVVSGVVLLGLLVSLAPSVTFWDAGEFVASMKVLGIPHPPGTPLFVMMGHVFGMVFPLGEFAFRTNLQSALFASAGAGCWFLVLQEAAGKYLGAEGERGIMSLRLAAGAAGALIAAFGFTNWLNSNETEVYAVATFTIAAVTWLLLRWRATRGSPQAARYLLLIAFLLGIAIGNHLLGLLVGPAAVAFMVAELRTRPAADAATARHEWGDAVLLAGLWSLLTGIGLGNLTLIVLGAVVFVLALLLAWMFAASSRQLGFGLLLLGIALVGVTPYLYLYIRSAQHPMINEAAPATWNALMDVIRRAQYEVRTPLDDPTFRHDDPNNPGRSLYLISLQLLNYLQYFDWQWAKSASLKLVGELTLRTLIMLGFLVLGTRGFLAQWRSDRSGAWLLLTLFLVTGLGLVAYMNFKPGFSLGYERYPNAEDHEVRERDYFFVVSFVVWGLWCGLGLLSLARRIRERLAGDRAETSRPPDLPASRRWLPYTVFAAALIPFALNFREADRQHGPDARLAGDFAYDLLNSIPPYGILFTYGDNDTFPLWWAQEVAGVRRDVTVVCLALAETDWYMRQLRDNPIRPFEAEQAPPIWRDSHPVAPAWPLHTMTDQEIDAALPQLLPNDVTLSIGPYRTTLPARSPVYGKDILALRVIQQNFGRRPIGWGLTAAGTTYGLERFLVQRGLAIMLEPAPVDTTRLDYDLRRLMGAPLDIPMTERLMNDTYRYARLLEGPHRELETTAKGIASTLGLPYTQLAFAMQARNDTARMRRYVERAALLSGNPALRSVFDSVVSR
jgi:transmembrane protein TMEM260 (protein O-mannosyltransferase)